VFDLCEGGAGGGLHNLALNGLDVNNRQREPAVEEIRLKIRSKETKTVTNTTG